MKAARDPLGQLIVTSISAITGVLVALAGVGVLLACFCRCQLHQMRRASDLIARVMFAGGALAKLRTRPGSAGRPS
jgi:hypothetical protein